MFITELIHYLTPAADVQYMSVTEKANEEKHSTPSISKNKKELKVSHRFSRRLAGIGPDMTNSVTHEQALQVPKRNLRQNRTTVDVDLEIKSSQQPIVVPKFESVHKMHGESLNESRSSSEIDPYFRDKPSHLVMEKIDDNMLEHKYSLTPESCTPRPKVAMKIITSESAMDDAHSGLGLASEANFVEEKKLHVSQIGKSDMSEISVNSNKSCDKERRASKRLAGIEPDVVVNSMDYKRAPEYKSRRRRSKGGVNAVLQQSEGRPTTKLVDHAFANGGSSIKSSKSPTIPPMADEQPEKLGDEEISDEKSEPQLSNAFLYSWSDPCLEFAIKTLTGVLPIECSAGNGPDLAHETDLFPRYKLVENAKESSGGRNLKENLKKTKNKKELRLPRRLSKRLAGYEPELVPSLRAVEYAPRKSWKTATVVLTNGVSKPLAGNKTELILDASEGFKSKVLQEPSDKCEVQTVEESNKDEKSCEAQIVSKEQPQKLESGASSETQLCLPVGKETDHSHHTLRACGSLVTKVLEDSSSKNEKSYEAQTVEEPSKIEKLFESQTASKEQPQRLETEVYSKTKLHLPVGKETDHILHASHSFKTRVFEDSLNKSEKSNEAQTVLSERQQKAEAEKFVNVQSEPEPCLPFGDFWSDPCLEFAIRTLTGSLPVDAAAEILPVMTPDIIDQQQRGLPDSKVKTNDEENHDNLNRPQIRNGINLVCEPSNEILKQPFFSSSSTFCENTPKFANCVSSSDEVALKSILDERESLHMEAGNTTKLAQPYGNGNMLIHEEPLKNIHQVSEIKAVPVEQPESATQIMSHETPESEFCAPFMDSWSDPCLEFAFKTLTGAITIEENLAIQGCFEEPANWLGRRDSGGSALPDLGPINFSQSDLASYYDMGEKSMPGQQSSTSLNGCAGYDPQEHYSPSNKNFQGR